MGQTAKVVLGGSKANAPGGHPLLRDTAVVGGSILTGLLINKLTQKKSTIPPVKPAVTPPAAPKPPAMPTAPDLGTTGGPNGRRTGRNATILTGPSGLGAIGSGNTQGKTLLGL